MKRYLLFYGSYYYPDGGWNDFEGDYDTVEEAMDDFILEHSDDWYQIIDSTNGTMVKYG